MKSNTNITILYKAAALLLALLFLMLSFVQVFHSHEDHTHAETNGEEVSIHSHDHCKICDFSVHKICKDMQLSYPPEKSLLLPKPITLSSKVYAHIYKFTLQGFTNKGPPVHLG